MSVKKILKSILYSFFISIVPIEKFIAFFKKPDCSTTGEQFLDLKSKIKDFDALFSETYFELSNGIKINGKYYLGIPGKYKHIGIYYQGMVYEAVTEGVRCVSLEEWFFKKDVVGLARCNMFSFDDLSAGQGLAFLKSCLGDEYDYDFADFTPKKQFCSSYWYQFMCAAFGDKFSNWFPMPLLFDVLPFLTPYDIWCKLDKVVQYNN